MTAEQFAYWLNGFVELSEWKQPTPEQWKSICEHLGAVFNKVTPPVQLGQQPGAYRSAELRLEDVLRNQRPGMPPAIC
jgi:hypothetical protein